MKLAAQLFAVVLGAASFTAFAFPGQPVVQFPGQPVVQFPGQPILQVKDLMPAQP